MKIIGTCTKYESRYHQFLVKTDFTKRGKGRSRCVFRSAESWHSIEWHYHSHLHHHSIFIYEFQTRGGISNQSEISRFRIIKMHVFLPVQPSFWIMKYLVNSWIEAVTHTVQPSQPCDDATMHASASWERHLKFRIASAIIKVSNVQAPWDLACRSSSHTIAITMSAAITFGSVGDILAICQILAGLAKALKGSQDSAKHYQSLLKRLDIYNNTMLQVSG